MVPERDKKKETTTTANVVTVQRIAFFLDKKRFAIMGMRTYQMAPEELNPLATRPPYDTPQKMMMTIP
jgi:hypothetical protein